MLRSHVDEHLIGMDVKLDYAGDLQLACSSSWPFYGNLFELLSFQGLGHARNARLLAADAVVFEGEFVVFPQGVADPVFRAEDAAEVRVVQKLDSNQVVGFASCQWAIAQMPATESTSGNFPA